MNIISVGLGICDEDTNTLTKGGTVEGVEF